jgi:RNA polymerase sigma-70 factor (ECF subfamily)
LVLTQEQVLVTTQKKRSVRKKAAELDDRELIERSLTGKLRGEREAAWEEIVRRYRRRVFGVAYKFTGKYEEAEDLAQEIFLRVFRSLDRFDRNADFGTWLYSVSRNHCIDRYRSGRREREALVDREISLEDFASVRFDPHRELEIRDNKQMLSRALQCLPVKLREAVVLRDIHGLTYQEIVYRLGLPEGTVKSRINRGRLELGRVLMGMTSDKCSGHGVSEATEEFI